MRFRVRAVFAFVQKEKEKNEGKKLKLWFLISQKWLARFI